VRDGALHGDSLLEQLSEARATSGGHKGGGSSSPSPINEAAVELWEEIGSNIRDKCADWCGYSVTSPTTALLAWAASFTAAATRGEVTPSQESASVAWLEGLASSISELLDPPKTVPIRGHACPECGASRVKVGRGILASEQPALIAIPAPLSISCRVCGAFAGGGAGIRQNVHEVVAFALRAGVHVDEGQIADALRGVA
jgi:hypothetical protein